MRTLLITLIAAVTAPAVIGCGSGNSASSPQSRSAGNSASTQQSRSAPNASAPHHVGYPRPFETGFMRSCKIRGTPSRCECALQYIEANVSYPDVINATPAIKAGRPPQWYIAAVTTCRNR